MIDNRIIFDSNCSIGKLENSLRSYYKGHNSNEGVILDMSSVSYIEAPSIIFLAGFIDKKITEKVDVKIQLPERKDIRNMLRYFRFPVLLNQLTKKRFQDLVVEDSLKWFGENINLKGDYRTFIKDSNRLDESALADALSDKKIFAEAIPFTNDFEKNNALEELHSVWSGSEMKAWLKKHLDGYEKNKERLIPNRIIYECVTNSQRHSEADKLVFAAIDYTPKSKKSENENNENQDGDTKKRFLDISFWDNGDSIIQTLEAQINKGDALRDKELEEDTRTKNIQATYYIKYDDNAFDKHLVNSDRDPVDFKLDKGMLLLSSFFPGVSKDPKGLHKWHPNPEFDGEDTALKHPGMGLTTLLNATIDLLGGQVSVRAENYFINIKKPENKKVIEAYNNSTELKNEKFYQVRIIEYENAEPKLKGNMLTVRLPLKAEDDRNLPNKI